MVLVIHHQDYNVPPPVWLRRTGKRLAKSLRIHSKHKTEAGEIIRKLPGIKDSQVSPATDAREEDKRATTHSSLFQFILDKENIKRLKELIKTEWQWIASVLNRLFFAVALFLNFVNSLIFILALY